MLQTKAAAYNDIQDIFGNKYFNSLKVAHILKRVNKVKNIDTIMRLYVNFQRKPSI